MKKLNFIFIVAILVLLCTGCADIVNVGQCTATEGAPYGFWGGTWHGMITIFSFIGSLFDDNIAIYAVNNNGAWYDFGFVGGLFIILRLIRLALKEMNS